MNVPFHALFKLVDMDTWIQTGLEIHRDVARVFMLLRINICQGPFVIGDGWALGVGGLAPPPLVKLRMFAAARSIILC